MPFTEKVKKEAKKRSHYRCCICKDPFVEVHHIIPQAEDGPDTIENAAPLCARCHDIVGGNPEKRKQIREMRDLWWELCEKSNPNAEFSKLCKKIDQLIESLKHNEQPLEDHSSEIASAYLDFYKTQEIRVQNSKSIKELSDAVDLEIRDPNAVYCRICNEPMKCMGELMTEEGRVLRFMCRNHHTQAGDLNW